MAIKCVEVLPVYPTCVLQMIVFCVLKLLLLRVQI